VRLIDPAQGALDLGGQLRAGDLGQTGALGRLFRLALGRRRAGRTRRRQGFAGISSVTA
jgi:hypothetical protein